MIEDNIERLAQLTAHSKKITFLTGAGISTESGIPDFRGSNGLWKNKQSFEYLISREYFLRHPEEFWQSYKEIFEIKLLGNYKPNKGHDFISNLQNFGKDITVITQNIDGLHSLSGTQNVYEVHGTLKTATCPKCQTKYDLHYINENELPLCTKIESKNQPCETILKPDVVLYGDLVHHFEEALNEAYDSDLLIVMGSSLMVSPINAIPEYLSRAKIPMVLINKEKTKMDYLFDLCIYASIGETVSQIEALI